MMRGVKRLSLVVVGLLLAGQAHAADPCADYIPQERPQNVGRDVVGQELDVLQDQGHMLFAVYADYPPYSWEEAGKAQGVDVEIAKLIAADLGIEARFNFVAAGENLEADLRNNIWVGPIVGGRISNVMMRIPYDSAFKCRVEQVVFTGQYASESIAIAYDKQSYPDEKPVPAYFRFDPVAVENDSISDFYLSSFAGGQLANHVQRFADMGLAMEALVGGQTKAAMGPLAQLEFGLNDSTAVHQPPLAGFAVSKWTLGVAVNFRYRPLSYAVDDAINYALQDGRIAKIYESFGLSFQPPDR
ncbi:amino acid ABC transporter substrate-binding protein (PAAT family) [Litoreibacter halocynthiae]|uniref:Amino acid ABC transporter substrate-binding protein (PAAT family) n=2 Tax=Litoreibacter halocynthiae TaxID=1242689 RepID=A0A4R7LPH1_9RHOB|nr:transporter substrate-binding domain-containing protein [Litoreibacter halocynthiae]TDT77379.1 amino acid ABC transporter substrate-binding protein (PAAT family) [Litoreibacter halocynthiae]